MRFRQFVHSRPRYSAFGRADSACHRIPRLGALDATRVRITCLTAAAAAAAASATIQLIINIYTTTQLIILAPFTPYHRHHPHQHATAVINHTHNPHRLRHCQHITIIIIHHTPHAHRELHTVNYYYLPPPQCPVAWRSIICIIISNVPLPISSPYLSTAHYYYYPRRIIT